jgi:hypothetical protein
LLQCRAAHRTTYAHVMKKTPSWHSLPRTSAEGAALLIFSTSLVCVCVALFGERLPILYLGISAGCTLVLAVFLRLQRSFSTSNGFTLDDNTRSIIPHNARPIPFDSIASFRLILYRDRACVQVMTGMLRRRRNLACVGRNGPDQNILQALRDRSFVVRTSKNPFTKRTAEIIPLIIMPLLAAALLYVNVDMFRQVPGLALPPQQLSVESTTARRNEAVHRLGTASFFLPRQYRLLRQQEQTFVFYNPNDAVQITINSGPVHATVPHKPFLQAIAGLLGYGNNYEAAMLAVRSRFGLIPALIKSALLQRYDASTVQIYHVSAAPLAGIMLRGEQNRQGEDNPGNMPDQVTEIMLHCSDKKLVIRILIASRLPIDIKRIERIIGGIVLVGT